MTDMQDLKRIARITRNAEGEPVVEIPLDVWQKFLSVAEPQPSQKQQIETLLDQWDREPENDMPDAWWDEFDEFIKQNRVKQANGS